MLNNSDLRRFLSPIDRLLPLRPVRDLGDAADLASGEGVALDATKVVDEVAPGVKTATKPPIEPHLPTDAAVALAVSADLLAVDPLPIWPLTQALLKARNADFRLKLVGVLAAIGPVEPLRVLVALGEAIKVEKDMSLKSATMNAMVAIAMTTGKACGLDD